MKLKSGYSLLTQNEDFSLVCECDETKKNIVLTKAGAYLWECAKDKDLETGEMLDLLLDRFEISTVLALGEIDTFIKKMKENGIIEE